MPAVARLALVLPLLVLLVACRDPRPPRFFVTDDQGRALVLHGVNVSNHTKNDPERSPWVAPADVDRLARDWGFNFARYLILWDALEPQPGRIDAAYLDRIEERMDWFAAAGVHVVLDMHQDVYARRFCCDGAPDWAIRDDGLPFAFQALWQLNYFQPAVTRAFDNFFDAAGPHADLQDHYTEAWVHVARRFRDHPAVIGYDLMNEPFPGSFMSKVELLGGEDPDNQAPYFDQALLRPFYERAIAAIRRVDENAWILYESHFAGPANGFPSYVEPVADTRAASPRLVSAPHFYSFLVDVAGVYTPDDPAFERWIRSRRREMALQKAPVVIGEWGAVETTQNLGPFVDRFLRMADAETAGWAIWAYDRDDGYGILDPGGREKAHVDRLVRTYPPRVAGQPLHVGYDPDARVMTLVFREKDGVTGPTEIYVPAARRYPDGFAVVVSDPDGEWSQAWDASRERLRVWTDPSRAVHSICVAPTPAGCPGR